MSIRKKLFLIAILSMLIVAGCNSDNEGNNNTPEKNNNDNISENNNNNNNNNNDNTENTDEDIDGFSVLEENKNVNEFYRNSYVPNTLKDEVLSDSMKVSLVDGKVIYEVTSNRLLKVQDDGDGMRTNVQSEIISADGEIKDEEYFFGDGEEVAEGAFEGNNLLKWKKDGNYYSLARGRTVNSYSKDEGSTQIRPEDDRLEGYQDLVKVDSDFVNLLPFAEKAIIPEQLPEGYKAVQVGYSYIPMRGYDPYTTEMWIHYMNKDGDYIYINMYSGYDDMSESEMRNENATIEGVEVSTNSLETKFIVDDVYYEIQHKDLDRDERESFIENLLK